MVKPSESALRAARQAARAALWGRTRWLNLAGHYGSAPIAVAIVWSLLDDPAPLYAYLAISWSLVVLFTLAVLAHAGVDARSPLPRFVYLALATSNVFLGGGLFTLTPEVASPSVVLALGIVMYAGTAGLLVTSGSQASLMRVALVSQLGSYALGCAWWGHYAIAVGTLFFLAVVALYTVDVITSTHDQMVDARFTADIRAEEAARALAAQQTAQKANDAKSRFLANMSHELRTPLNVMLGYAELADEDLADRQLDAVAEDLLRIRSAGRQLLALISDVLDLTKIEAQQLSMTFARVALASELTQVVELMQPLTAEHGNRLTLVLPEPDALEAWCDVARTRQIVLNLVANANKFTDDGEITIVGTVEASSVRIEVRDTGSGIPEEQLERIFERFSQVDETTTRSRDGAGLGLAISRALAHAMGGELWAMSTVGVGSTFVLELPVEARTKPLLSARA